MSPESLASFQSIPSGHTIVDSYMELLVAYFFGSSCRSCFEMSESITTSTSSSTWEKIQRLDKFPIKTQILQPE